MSTYKRIAAVTTAAEILKFLSRQKEPVAGAVVAAGLGLPAGTAMCHIVTLEDQGFVRKIGEGYELGMALMLFWAAKKAQLAGQIEKLQADLHSIDVP